MDPFNQIYKETAYSEATQAADYKQDQTGYKFCVERLGNSGIKPWVTLSVAMCILPIGYNVTVT